MNREQFKQRLKSSGSEWDVIVIGGGATGLGVAVDAASRGLRTVLLEQHDFAKATSSRSTKIAHGGVRYLQQGDFRLVFEALHERALMIQNAPHLVRPLVYMVPAYHWWQLPFYGTGLKLYDALAGSSSLGSSRILTKVEALRRLPGVRADGLQGGILYMDGQFDDARLALTLALTLEDLGGIALNYFQVERLIKAKGLVCGVQARDLETDEVLELRAKAVVNATGIFTDMLRQMDEPGVPDILSVSQGTHIVVDGSFLPGEVALMIPKTEDGRVLFGIPWYGHLVIGTTDVPRDSASLEPKPLEEEIAFLIHHANLYLEKPLRREHILSAFSGLRPLVRAAGTSDTSKLSRSHRILVSGSKLVTITGGKWTTYRRMAEETMDRVVGICGLESPPSGTRQMRLHGAENLADHGSESVYGSDAAILREWERQDPDLACLVHPDLTLTVGQVLWAVRREMALNVEDILARRSRSLLLNARASAEAAEPVAGILARERGKDAEWEQEQIRTFRALADCYIV